MRVVLSYMMKLVLSYIMKLVLGYTILGWISIQQCSAQTVVMPVSVVPGGILNITNEGVNNYYGNNIGQSAVIARGVEKTWIDEHTTLHSGILKQFIIYAGPVSKSINVRLQIWRPTGTVGAYTLFYEIAVVIDSTSQPNGAMYTYNVTSPKVIIQTGDLMGFTNGNDAGAINFLVTPNYILFFKALTLDANLNPIYPTINQTILLETINFPFIPAIATLIDPRLPGPTGATGVLGATGTTGTMGNTVRTTTTTMMSSTTTTTPTTIIPTTRISAAGEVIVKNSGAPNIVRSLSATSLIFISWITG